MEDVDVEMWMSLFYDATASFQELDDEEWAEIEVLMNFEYVEISIDEE